jgi:hypothetical protein
LNSWVYSFCWSELIACWSIKNKSLIYLETQYKKESISFRIFKVCISSQYATKRLVIKETQLVFMAILCICFKISSGTKVYSKSVNSTKVNQRRDVRFISVSLSLKMSFRVVSRNSCCCCLPKSIVNFVRESIWL